MQNIYLQRPPPLNCCPRCDRIVWGGGALCNEQPLISPDFHKDLLYTITFES